MLTHSRILALSAVLVALPAAAAETLVNFAREILPILSDKCFVCHGPDTKKQNQLRLDSHDSATADRGGYRAINPDSPAKSALIKRIFDKDDPMPPADAERQLTETERELLRRWVLQGGQYTTHWAFVSPTREKARTIDSFVAEKLKENGIDFAPEANRATLARRVALVLTGLPPEPEHLRRFLADQRKGADSRFVDELLASSGFGEHQARYWLDAVRYGDTHGLHLDNRRGIYPYRDWVVRAFNENLPLDKFITWQLAGDLLPEPTLEQLVATGFVRMNPTTGEGGAIAAEFQVKNNFDRVETLGTALLGMSLTCARCHTHKYDPIPQTEYYRLMAFFNSTAESALDGNAYLYGPVASVPPDTEAWREWEQMKATRANLLKEFSPKHREMFVAHAELTTGWETSEWKLSKAVAIDAKMPSEKDWKAVNGLPGKIGEKLPKANQASWLSFDVTTPIYQTLWFSFASNPGYQVEMDGAAISEAKRSFPVALTPGKHQLRLKLIGSPDKIPIEIQLINAWKQLAESKNWEKCSESDRLQMLADSKGPPGNRELERAAHPLALRLTALEGGFTTTLIARDLDKPRETRLLKRGEYDLPTGDPLEPGILNVVGAFPEDAPRNRLGLAQWLTSREHPLVARVLINRVWQRVFGYGLVRTPEDFGLQGEQPTHPELLNWLAVELQESGWNLKHMIRLMLSSRTFRQDSAWRKGIEDPENRLFARGPRYRLDAEVLRDIGLWASGLLDPHIGGEGVKPYQPAGMWRALTHPGSNTVQYEADKGRQVYRRSLYVYWKRTSPHPMMTLFDAPSREASCVRRSRSNTPVQSLAMFNETQRLEMARTLAQRLLTEKTDGRRMNLLFTLLACREPNAVERKACTQLLAAMRARYQATPDDARALLATDAVGDTVEAAAWAQVASAVLASDVTILLY
mgnify:CR=1 FL=1